MAAGTLMLVHGAWHGGWSWGGMPQILNERGIETVVVDLPGVGRSSGGHDLAGHVEYVRRQAEAVDGPLAVCAHSYGGAVVSEAFEQVDALSTMIFVAAFMLEPGQTSADANRLTTTGPEHMPVRDGDYTRVTPAAARYLYYGDASPAQAEAATQRMTPEHIGTTKSAVQAAAWRRVPSTYIVTERDAAVSPAAQRLMADNATWQESLDSDHSPMLSHPRQLADLIVRAYERGLRSNGDANR